VSVLLENDSLDFAKMLYDKMSNEERLRTFIDYIARSSEDMDIENAIDEYDKTIR